MAAPLSLAALTPKTLFLIGVPIAGIAALASSRKKKSPTGVMVATPNTNDSAIGTGQLTDFENSLLAAISAIAPAGEQGSPSAPTANPAPVATPAPITVAPAVPTPVPTAAYPTVGTLNSAPVVQTPQGFSGQFETPAPGVSYTGLVDLVDPRTGLATITGLTAVEAAKYGGYNTVAHGTVPVPTGELAHGSNAAAHAGDDLVAYIAGAAH